MKLRLYAVVLLVALAGCRSLAVNVADGSVEKTPGWPTYHGGSGLTGVSQTPVPLEGLGQTWRFKTDSGVEYTPVVGDDRIYFTSAKGTIYAVSMQGSELWQRTLSAKQPDGTEGIAKFSTPTLYVNGTVLLGTFDQKLHALDAADGKPRWTYDAEGPIQGTPNWAVGGNGEYRVILIRQSDGAIHCVELDSGKRAWLAEGPRRCDGSPSVDSGLIAFGSCAATIHIRSATDGSRKDDIVLEPGNEVAGGVAIEGNNIFTGSRSGKFFCIDIKEQSLRWTNEEIRVELFTTPAVAGTRVVFAAAGLICCANRADGKTLWKAELKGGRLGSPVIAGTRVVVSAGGTLHILKLEDGEKLWSQELANALTSPAIAGGQILVGADDGYVFALGGK